MQNTRINNLIEVIYTQLKRWLQNPWRKLSLIIIGFLLGFFLGTAIPTTLGQKAELDIVSAGFVLLITEVISLLIYKYNVARLFMGTLLNSIKIGLTYALFVEAFKLGS